MAWILGAQINTVAYTGSEVKTINLTSAVNLSKNSTDSNPLESPDAYKYAEQTLDRVWFAICTTQILFHYVQNHY